MSDAREAPRKRRLPELPANPRVRSGRHDTKAGPPTGDSGMLWNNTHKTQPERKAASVIGKAWRGRTALHLILTHRQRRRFAVGENAATGARMRPFPLPDPPPHDASAWQACFSTPVSTDPAKSPSPVAHLARHPRVSDRQNGGALSQSNSTDSQRQRSAAQCNTMRRAEKSAERRICTGTPGRAVGYACNTGTNRAATVARRLTASSRTPSRSRRTR